MKVLLILLLFLLPQTLFAMRDLTKLRIFEIDGVGDMVPIYDGDPMKMKASGGLVLDTIILQKGLDKKLRNKLLNHEIGHYLMEGADTNGFKDYTSPSWEKYDTSFLSHAERAAYAFSDMLDGVNVGLENKKALIKLISENNEEKVQVYRSVFNRNK